MHSVFHRKQKKKKHTEFFLKNKYCFISFCSNGFYIFFIILEMEKEH